MKSVSEEDVALPALMKEIEVTTNMYAVNALSNLGEFSQLRSVTVETHPLLGSRLILYHCFNISSATYSALLWFSGFIQISDVPFCISTNTSGHETGPAPILPSTLGMLNPPVDQSNVSCVDTSVVRSEMLQVLQCYRSLYP